MTKVARIAADICMYVCVSVCVKERMFLSIHWTMFIEMRYRCRCNRALCMNSHAKVMSQCTKLLNSSCVFVRFCLIFNFIKIEAQNKKKKMKKKKTNKTRSCTPFKCTFNNYNDEINAINFNECNVYRRIDFDLIALRCSIRMQNHINLFERDNKKYGKNKEI